MSATWESPVLGLYKNEATAAVQDGCTMAARYATVQAEYERLRKGIGLVDDNHYGKFVLQGSAALDVVNRVTLADVSRLAINRMLVTYMLKPDSAVRCEVYVVHQRDGYLLLTDGAPPDEVLTVLKEECQSHQGSVTLTDSTRTVGLIGLDGPFAWELLKDLVGVGILGTRFLGVLEEQTVADIPVTIFRAGKTGEFGYLLKVDGKQTIPLWQRLQEAGKEYDVTPCGFEAIDMCKLENRVVNMKCEGKRAQNALELNCRYMVPRDKDNYVGEAAIKDAVAHGPQRRLIGLTMAWPNASATQAGPAPDSPIQHQGTAIGTLANTTWSFTLGKQIGLAFIQTPYAYVGLDYTLQAGGVSCPVRTVSAPFIMNRSISIRPQEDSYKAAHA